MRYNDSLLKEFAARRRRGASVCATRYPQSGRPSLSAGDAAAEAASARLTFRRPHRQLSRTGLLEYYYEKFLYGDTEAVSVARASAVAHSRNELERGLHLRLHAGRAAHAAVDGRGGASILTGSTQAWRPCQWLSRPRRRFLVFFPRSNCEDRTSGPIPVNLIESRSPMAAFTTTWECGCSGAWSGRGWRARCD